MKERNQERWMKAQSLLEKLTLDEKIAVVHGAELFCTGAVPRLGIPKLRMSDGPMGVRKEFKPDCWADVGLSDDYVTYLPCNSALAATWNRELAYETGSVLGEEARGRGKDVILGPGINIKRSPLCGRNFEYFSEDPYLTKELAVPYIQGVQQWDVAACVKHFAVNNQETERLWVDVEIEEEALRTIYLPAFYDAVTKADSYTIMGAYNKVNGEHCCQHQQLLDDILRKEWKYDGTVISDWGAVHDTVEAANSQLDIEMSVTNDFDQYYLAEPLKKAITEGTVKEEVLDEKVMHILYLMMRLHMIDGNRKSGTYNTEEHRQKAKMAARESVVLLKNDEKRLPLCETEIQRLLVIGENANCAHAAGGGSAEIKALYEITPLMGIKKLLGGNAKVTYIQGYCRKDKKEEPETNWQETSLEDGGGKTTHQEADDALKEKRKQMREEALCVAKEYDHIIFIGGLNHDQDCEGNDRADMKLPYEQDELIQELLKINPHTIVTLVAGSPVEMGTWIDAAKTVVWGWYAGMEGGTALAEVLFGKINPSGKLPETFYKTHLDCSAHAVGEFPGGKSVAYKEGVFVGYRYNDTYQVQPQFCFGHGLSYTEFALSEIQVEAKQSCVICNVTNTGDMTGKEVVQVYLSPKLCDKKQPVKELKGFEKVELLPGETKTVEVKMEEGVEGRHVWVGTSLERLEQIM